MRTESYIYLLWLYYIIIIYLFIVIVLYNNYIIYIILQYVPFPIRPNTHSFSHHYQERLNRNIKLFSDCFYTTTSLPHYANHRSNYGNEQNSVSISF